MRISDWSSDVCSSDLDALLLLRPEGQLLRPRAARRGQPAARAHGGAGGGAERRAAGQLLRARQQRALQFAGDDRRRRPPARRLSQVPHYRLAGLPGNIKTEERRSGKECDSKCRSLWSTDRLNKKQGEIKVGRLGVTIA